MSETPNKPGPTGKFPDGKLHPGDQGQLAMGIAHDSQRRVHFNFGAEVSWFCLTQPEAINFARMILREAGAKKVEIEL